MQIEEAIRFFGYPHENKEFDSYLNSVGIDEGPDWGDNLVAYVSNDNDGFVFIFGSKST